jgi:hypothetical protein
MSISTSPSSVVPAARRATVANDVNSEPGPWPGMSQRAKLIARSLVFASASAWIAATDTGLLGAAAAAVPIWIGSELALAQRRSARRALRVDRFALDRPTGARFSDPCAHAVTKRLRVVPISRGVSGRPGFLKFLNT